MNEIMCGVVNDTVNIAEQYAEKVSNATDIGIPIICLIGIVLAIIAYKITKNILSIICSLVVYILIIVVVKQLGLF